MYDSNHGYEDEDEGLILDSICLNDFSELELPKREMLLSPILPQKGLAMLYAGRGIGKTHVALGIAYAVSCGTSFLRWKAEKPTSVLYIDGEMPQQALQERLQAIMAATDKRPRDGDFRLLSMDRQELGTSLNLADSKHQEVINNHLDETTAFLVLDNMSTLMNGGPENDSESWISMQNWLLQLRRRGVTVLVVHHASRNGNARGTSKREDVLDTIIQLKHPEGYDPSEGARFEVHLTKARGLFGEDAAAFEAKLDVDEEGRAEWICSDIENSDGTDPEQLRKVLEMSEQGMSIRDIAKKLHISKTVIGRQLKQAKKAAAKESEVVDASDPPIVPASQ